MIPALRLAPLLFRRGGRSSAGIVALTAVGVAVSTLFVTLALSAAPALAARADRMAWREPAPAERREALVWQRRTFDLFEGQRIDRVDLAPTASLRGSGTGSGAAGGPTPPGLERFPAPGEVFVSPALARLLARTPSERLGDRFPGTVVGTIGPEGLADDDELVAVVGRSTDALAPVGSAEPGADGAARPFDPTEPMGANRIAVGVASFSTTGTDATLAMLRQIALVATVLLAVPSLLLIGSAARLAAARRDERLAALRLAGASPAGVVVLTALESALAGLIGALLGVGLYAVALPVGASLPLLELGGAPWRTADLWLGASSLAVIVAVVPMVVTVAAVIGLRRVVIGPLGVSARVGVRHPNALRLVGLVAAGATIVWGTSEASSGAGVGPFLLGIGAVFGALALVGPWVTWSLGRGTTALARRASTLVAGRRILDDPKAAFRTVSGIVLAGFVLGFVFGVLPSLERDADPRVDRGPWSFPVPAAAAANFADDLDGAVASVGALAEVERPAPGELGSIVDDVGIVSVRLVAGGDVERLRTVLAPVLDGRPLGAPDDTAVVALFGDLRRGAFVLSLFSLALATTAGSLGAAASVLDQRATLRRLRLSGTPTSVLHRARVWQSVVPLAGATALSVGGGLATGVLALTALGASDERVVSPSLDGPLVVLVAGVVAGWLAAAITRPLLVRVSTTD